MHDFNTFPELTNNQMDFYYWESPHVQIVEDFSAKVVKVHDGDTITLRWEERDFDFPLRIIDLASPELDEKGGEDSQAWLEKQVLGMIVDIEMDPFNRVEKWGRLLGRVWLHGIDIGEESIYQGHALHWEDRKQGSIPNFESFLKSPMTW